MIKEKFLRIALHLFLAILCFFTVTIAGVQWLNKNPLELSNFLIGLPYSLSLLAIITAHEFGHYFAARYHSVDTTLPFYIPAPSFLLNPFGTLGAVIRIRQPLTNRKALFDIGIAGPIAGLIVTFFVLTLGFLNLPDKAFLYTIHPEYQTSPIPEGGLTFGSSLFFQFLRVIFQDYGFIPPMNEIYHYPFLCAGWFGLFITAMNLLPVGQLDGGHILYALLGKYQSPVSRVVFGTIVFLGISGFIPGTPWTYEPAMVSWLIWAAILFFFIKIDHPPIADETPLDPNRTLLGWATLGFFIFIFMPLPFAGWQ